MIVFGPDHPAGSFDLSETRREVVAMVERMRHPALVATVLGLKSTAKKQKTSYQSVTSNNDMLVNRLIKPRNGKWREKVEEIWWLS